MIRSEPALSRKAWQFERIPACDQAPCLSQGSIAALGATGISVYIFTRFESSGCEVSLKKMVVEGYVGPIWGDSLNPKPRRFWETLNPMAFC